MVWCIKPMTVELKLPKVLKHVHNVFHFSLLKQNPGLYPLQTIETVPPDIEMDGEVHYEVAEILDSNIKHNTFFYLIKWKSFPLGEST